ncbi:MAG: aminotransferase class V-fold PLP-dependent enzyme [Caldilineaceae bacterium]|nr:aminotransferase class V-fold PLP-dependent enzyme [Caldilineaceae bacterium]
MSHEIAEIREHFPATLTQAYLNTGSAGPLSRPAAEAIEILNRRQLHEGRSNFSIYLDEYMPMQNRLRGQLARLFNADEDEIALTLHTTNGMNIATWGLRWQPGDEIVTDSHEHPGGLLPVYAVARRFGLTVRVAQVALSDDDEALIEKFRRAINARTRLVSISHVSWKTGAVLPVAEITRIAHAHGALVVVDGAQSGGAIPIDVQALGVDFYAIPGQKWLCGPEGTGALFVRRDRLADLNPTFVGYPSHKALDTEGNFLPAAGAKRFEMGTVYWPGIAGLHASMSLREELDNGWIYNQIGQITATCREMLEEIPGVVVVTPPAQSGLLSFQMEGVKPDEAVAKLVEQKIVIRSVHEPDLLRVSTSFYNDEADILRLRDALEGIRSL